MSIDEAISTLVGLGEVDPVEIAQKLIARHGAAWVSSELAVRAEELVAEMARRQLSAVRRKAEVALRPGDELASAELKVAKAWVPSVGWKRAADLTADDLLARAEWYESYASAAGVRAAWCRSVVALMVAEGVATLGELEVALPPLPDASSVLELVA